MYTMLENVARLTKDLKKFTSKFIDVTIYSIEEWNIKENNNSNFGQIVLTCEGELNHILNGYTNDKKTLNRLKDIAKKHGFYIEQGFSWSWHFVEI